MEGWGEVRAEANVEGEEGVVCIRNAWCRFSSTTGEWVVIGAE